MARVTERDRVKRWHSRLESADKAYKEWEDEFNVNSLEKYYKGKQWAQDGDHYTINMVFPTVEIRLPSMMFNKPIAHFSVKPSRANDVGSHLDLRAKFLEDVANHFVQSDDSGFRDETLLSTKESLMRFGIIEVGYSANYNDNPNAGKPVLSESTGQELKDADGQSVLAPPYIIENELIFIRRISAKCFRTPANSKNRLDKNDWVGYYEWMWASDIRRNPFYKNRLKVKSNGTIDEKYRAVTEVDDDDDQKDGMVKVWKIWDIRRKVKHVFPDNAEFFLIEDEPFKYLPFADLKFHELMDQYLPLPYLSQLISPQDELNETRDMQRVHRRRFARRYEVRENAVDDVELQKLEGPAIDGQYIVVRQLGSIQPIPDAALDRSVAMNVPTTKEDFMMISSVGGEQRGVSDADTATQANIIASNANVRNSFSRELVAKFLAKVIKLIVVTARDNMSLGWYMKSMIDPKAMGAAQEAQMVGALWQEVTSTDIGDLDFEVQIDVESLAPDSEDRRREQWNQVLALFGNQALMTVMMTSDTILRKTLGYYGLKSDREVNEIRNAMQQMFQMTMMMQAGVPPTIAGGGGAAGPPEDAQIRNGMEAKAKG